MAVDGLWRAPVRLSPGTELEGALGMHERRASADRGPRSRQTPAVTCQAQFWMVQRMTVVFCTHTTRVLYAALLRPFIMSGQELKQTITSLCKIAYNLGAHVVQ